MSFTPACGLAVTSPAWATEWHQGQGRFAGYRWYGDVSVDNLNAILYGYAVYYDLGADEAQKKWIAHEVDLLVTHVLDNRCRIIDVDGEVTMWGHIGMDPDPSLDEYYRNLWRTRFAHHRMPVSAEWKPPLRASMYLLADLLIADHMTGKSRYKDFYRKVMARFGGNPDFPRWGGPFSLEKVARIDHSSEGQAYEACYILYRYLDLWREQRTGAADFVHAYWMGRYYGHLPEN